MGLGFVEEILDSIDTFKAYLQQSVRTTMSSYNHLQTADSATSLVTHDGSLLSIVQLHGVTTLVGQSEYEYIHDMLLQSLQNSLNKKGHSVQVLFSYNKDNIRDVLAHHMRASKDTTHGLNLELDDVFDERVDNLSRYCSEEVCYAVLWTKFTILGSEELRKANEDQNRLRKESKYPPVRYTQNIMAAFNDLRDTHDSFVRSFQADCGSAGMQVNVLDVHDALYRVRLTIDPDFTDKAWRPILPGDRYNPKIAKHYAGDPGDILWPSLSRQLFPRDAENLNMRTCRIGDKIYAAVFIDLFPKEIKSFTVLFNRTLQTKIPWRISFLVDGGGMESLRIKRMLSSLLSFSSAQNRLINDSVALLDYINLNADDAVVKYRVAAATWAPVGHEKALSMQTAQLARALQGWGSCDVSEVCGDAFEGVVSSMLGVSMESVATTTVASLSDVIYMLPFYRPASPWQSGALMFRSPDGKPWPYQPGSPLQTTWIDLIYARPGSGKSVLSNALNLALVLSAGAKRLPRVSIIDIGPSSAGLISLIREALPMNQRHLVAYHRLKMSADYAINPFDTQLGLRAPLAPERSFLVNFISLLATPLGSTTPYDGIADMIGMIVDEAYKSLMDGQNPNGYNAGIEELIDAILEEIGFVTDQHTTWWEVTDALFAAGFEHEAMLAQRHAVPVLGDLTSICRLPVVEDLYSKVTTPTGENLIDAFNRMISSAVREFPVLSRITQFDIGDARITSLDLDEVAKGGGAAGERQTAVMYMLSRYVIGRNFYLNEEVSQQAPEIYKAYHEQRVSEILEDPKRLIYDEFHRTSSAEAVRNQVILDMREGRKWNVQIGLISQSLDDFDKVMVEFGTSIFIMDAGPEQAINKTAKVFGLEATAKAALRSHVRGPRSGGATFLALFATKESMNTQLLTLTLGPIELWAFSTTAADVMIRNQLYLKLGPVEARRVLARLFPSGSASKLVSKLLEKEQESSGLIEEEKKASILASIVENILSEYRKDKHFNSLTL